MGVGYLLTPIVFILFFIIPIGLFFYKKINKRLRQVLLLLPTSLTLIILIYVIVDERKSSKLYAKYPQINTLMFANSTDAVRDSIIQLQILMEKLPKRIDHESVEYSIDKYPNSLNVFSFNRIKIGAFDNLNTVDKFRNAVIPNSQKIHREKYIGTDFKPFDVLSIPEADRLINLITYLDKNKLNGASLKLGVTLLSYNDSLRISENVGFRSIIIDTNNFYGTDIYDIIDSKDEIYLLRRK